MVGNDAVNWLDLLGLRALTAEEKGVVSSLEGLAVDAVNNGDEEFSAAVKSVIKDYQELIQKLPDLERYNTHRTLLTTRALLRWQDKEVARTYLQANGVGKWKGQDKCNKYVADVTGFQTFVQHPIKGFIQRPPLAGEWANPKLFRREYTAIWKVIPIDYHGGGMVIVKLEQDTEPRLGDVIAIGKPTTVGSAAHVGIYLGSGMYVSASSAGVQGQKGLVIKRVPSDGVPQILFRSSGK
jgi:hypothetical protein